MRWKVFNLVDVAEFIVVPASYAHDAGAGPSCGGQIFYFPTNTLFFFQLSLSSVILFFEYLL